MYMQSEVTYYSMVSIHYVQAEVVYMYMHVCKAMHNTCTYVYLIV